MQTLNLHPQYVKGADDQPLGVFITVAEFQCILEDLEELADLKTVEAFELRDDKEYLPFRLALDEKKQGLVQK